MQHSEALVQGSPSLALSHLPENYKMKPLFDQLSYFQIHNSSVIKEMTQIRNMKDMEAKKLFKLLLERENTIQIVAKYQIKAIELRFFLVENHRKFI